MSIPGMQTAQPEAISEGGHAHELCARRRRLLEPSDEADPIERGLTYGIRSASSGERAGPFMITSFTRVDKVRELIDLKSVLLSEVKTAITQGELDDAKGYYLGSYPLSLETVEGEGGKLLQAACYGLGDDFISAYLKRLEAVTLEAVNALAKSLLEPDKLVIVLVGPKDRFIESVKDLGRCAPPGGKMTDPVSVTP